MGSYDWKSEIPLYSERTIDKLVERSADQYEDRTFLIYEDQKYSYWDLQRLSERIAGGMGQIGVKKGDRVAIFLPNCPEFIFTWFGLMRMGAIEVPVNIEQKGELFSYLLNNCQAKVIVTTLELLSRVIEVADELLHLEHIILVGQENRKEMTQIPERFQVHFFEELGNAPIYIEESPVSPADPFCFMYTSGTTGNSKGVILPHNYGIYSGDMIKYLIEINENDVIYICLPLFHGNAQILAIIPAMIAGASVVLDSRFSASRFWEQVRKYNVTITNLVGSIVAILLKAKPTIHDRDQSLRIVFTAATPKQLFTEFEERFGVTIIEGFGSTECGMVLMNRKEERKIGSIGKVVPGYEVQIVDDDDQPLKPGEVGEIVTRPRYPFIMMQGYYNMPEETLKAFRNLWFHTGDLGYYDEDGFFYFVDRKKDVIRRRGENISSSEVERIVNLHPEVVESAVVGVPSELGEEEVKAVVVRRPESSLSYEELHRYCQEKMARFMVPRFIEWADQLPKSATQRIQKYKLRQVGVTDRTWDCERGQSM